MWRINHILRKNMICVNNCSCYYISFIIKKIILLIIQDGLSYSDLEEFLVILLADTVVINFSVTFFLRQFALSPLCHELYINQDELVLQCSIVLMCNLFCQ